MPNINCNVDRTKHKKLFEIIKEWASSEKAIANFRDSHEAALKMVDTVWGGIDAETLLQVPITDGQIEKYKRQLQKLNDSIDNGTLGNKFSTSFWSTSHYGKKDPIVSSLFSNMQRIQQRYTENNNEMTRIRIAIQDDINKAAYAEGLSKQDKNTAQKQLDNLNELYAKAKVAQVNNDANWRDLHKQYADAEAEVMNGTYGKIMDTFVKIVEKDLPELAKKYDVSTDFQIPKDKLIKDLRKKYPEVSSSLISAVDKHIGLTNRLYTILERGVENHISTIVKKLEETGRIQESQQLTAVKKRLKDTLLPNREKGFFPHFTRDFNITFMEGYMSKIEDLQQSVNPYNLTKKTKTVKEAIQDINSYISNHNKGRAKDSDGNFIYTYSKNIPQVLSAYSNDVIRFNLNSFMNKAYLDALSGIERIYKTDGNANGYALSISKYIQDMNLAYNGNNKNAISTSDLTRAILSFEFISKLGFNVRGAARNYTQRMLDWVSFGFTQPKRIRRYLENEGISDGELTKVLNEKGILYDDATVDIKETIGKTPANELNMVEYDADANKFKYVKKTRMAKLADLLGKGAQWSSGLHRKAENVNRKRTFVSGFGMMHKFLNNVDYKAKLAEKGLNEQQIKNKINKTAEKFAINMVMLNHFDYSQYAKSPFMRTKLGAIIGQFQHYSFEFYERNMGILTEAKGDIKSGKVMKKLLERNGGAEGLSQAYRMGLLYFIAPVAAAALTGLNFKNLVQHDTAERIERMAILLSGDEEAIEEISYGKSVIANMGGPAFDTMLDIGIKFNFIDLENDALAQVFATTESYDSDYDLPNTAKLHGIVNVATSRMAQRALPQIMQGRIGWAVQSELGLYASADAKEVQKKAMDFVGLDPRSKTEKKKSKKKQSVLQSLDFIAA